MSSTIDKFRTAEAILSGWAVPWVERDNFTTNAGANIATSFKGVLNHHTGAWTTSDAMLYKDGNGVTPAPLCNVSIDREGVITFGTGLYANHAGYNDKNAVMAVIAGPPLDSEIKPGKDDTNPKFSGNRYLIGNEVKCPGSYNEAQYAATVALNAALVLAFGWSVTDPPIGAHKEITRRKPGDPGDDMAKFRQDVVAFIAEKTAQPVPTPDPVPEPVPFPLPSGYYFGPKSGPAKSVSGYYGRKFGDKTDTEWLKMWQRAAKTNGDYTGQIDGLFGRLSRKAAYRTQVKHNLKRTHVVDKATWEAIL